MRDRWARTVLVSLFVAIFGWGGLLLISIIRMAYDDHQNLQTFQRDTQTELYNHEKRIHKLEQK